MKNIIRSIINKISRRDIYQEALEAYFYRLPEKIEVHWFRDGQYIVGDIKTDDKNCITQAYTPSEFVSMVNDAIMTVYDIPEEYHTILRRYKAYQPPPEQWAQLNNQTVQKGLFGSERIKQSQAA